MNKRAYLVHNGDEDQSVVSVVATSAKEAKNIAYKSGKLIYGDTGWIDIRVKWQRDAKVDDLPIGVLHDDREGLLRGIYGFVVGYPCDVCGYDDIPVRCHENRVICDDCNYRKQKSDALPP